MKKILLFLMFLCISHIALATPTYVRGNNTEGNPVTTITLPSNNAGDLIIVGEETTGTLTTTPTDSAGNTYTLVENNGNQPWFYRMWYAKNINASAGTNTITFTNSAGYGRLMAAEYSGISATTTAVSGQNFGTGTSMTAGSISTTSGDLVVGYFFNASDSVTVGSGYTDRTASDPSSTMLEDKISTGGTDNPPAGSANDAWTAIGATFQAGANAPVTHTNTINGATISNATIQ